MTQNLIKHVNLPFQAKSLGLLDPPTKGRGRGSLRGRGRGTPVRSRPLPRTTRVWTRDSASLDHRPKQITVGEITPEQKEDIAEHFKVSAYLKKCLKEQCHGAFAQNRL